MNHSPASNFIEKILGKNREVLLGIIRALFFEIHDLVLSDFFLKGKNEKLFEFKRNQYLSDFSSAADLFRGARYLNNRILKYNSSKKMEVPHPISLARLEKEIRFTIDDNLAREKIKAKIQNDYFNLDVIDQIASIVLDINSLRNRNEHELSSFDFSQASLLFGYLNRLMALTPDHILESNENYKMYSDFLNNEFKALTKIYIPTEEDELSTVTKPSANIDLDDLATKISDQIKEDNDAKDKEIKDLKDAKDKEIEALKDQLEKNTPKYFYAYDLKKEYYEDLATEKDERGFFKTKSAVITSSKEDLAWFKALRPDCTPMWGGIGEPSSVPNFYIPFGAAQDKYGHIYKFHDKNDPFFSTDNMSGFAKNYMFSIEEIEASWGPFDEPLEIIRELSVTYTDENYTDEEWEAYSTFKGLWNENPEDVLTPRQLELVKEIEARLPIVIPIKDWKYPKASFDKPAEEPLSISVDKHPSDFNWEDLDRPTIETIIRKTRKETREQLLELRNKIYTIMTNLTAFDHWDSILNSKIIRNILNERIFTSEDFKKADIKPGYIWKTASKQQAAPYVKRDQASLELMDLQINQFWEEVQDITRNYFFDYDYIYNNKNRPWVKASLKYTEKDYSENTDLYQEVFDYLHKTEPSLKIDSSPFNEFSLSFIKAIKRNMKEFPNDDLTWEAKGNRFVIKKLRK